MVYHFNSVTGLLFFEQVVHFFIDIYKLNFVKLLQKNDNFIQLLFDLISL